MKEERSASAQVQDGEVENGAAEELVGSSVGNAKEGGNGDGKLEGKWKSMTACSSPKSKSPLAVSTEQDSHSATRPTPPSKSSSNGAPSWHALGGLPSQEGLHSMLSSFDFFSNEEYSDGDKTAISIAFGK